MPAENTNTNNHYGLMDIGPMDCEDINSNSVKIKISTEDTEAKQDIQIPKRYNSYSTVYNNID